MSLLLDARKKIERALEQSGVHTAIEPQLSETMRHESLPPPAATASSVKSAPMGAPLLHNDPVAAGKNLFAAKIAPTRARGRLGIIPIALISGAVIAAGGGYYVWREISPPAMAQRQYSPPPATPIANAAPAAASVPQPAPIPAAKDKPALANADMQQSHGEEQSKRAHVVTDTAPPTSHGATATAEQPVRIEHKQEADAVDPTLLAGYQAYRNGDLRTAWQQYSDVLKKDAKNRDALLGMAAIAQQQSQDDTAASYYRQALALDPRDPIAHAGMLSLLGPGNEAGAESRLKLLLSQQPQSAALHFALGNNYAAQSRWGEAQQAYFNAYNIDSGNAQFAFNLAVSLDHLGKGKLAAQHYQRALQLDTSDSAGFNRAQTQRRVNELTAP